jgi:hypothetical protein
MAFMLPMIEHADWWEVESSDGGTYVVPASLVGDINPSNPDDLATFCDYIEGAPESAERRTAWGARLSAPGYMDCTPWTLHETEAAARRELRDTYEVCPWTGDPIPCEESAHGPALVAHVEVCAECTDTGACECGECNRDTADVVGADAEGGA